MGIKFSRSARIIGGQSELDEYVNRSVVLRINKSDLLMAVECCNRLVGMDFPLPRIAI